MLEGQYIHIKFPTEDRCQFKSDDKNKNKNIHDIARLALLDSGSTKSCIAHKVVQNCSYLRHLPKFDIKDEKDRIATLANGKKLVYNYCVKPKVIIGKRVFKVTLFVSKQLASYIILGNQFLA